MAGFAETWNSIPWVTRHVGAVAIALLTVNLFNPYWTVLAWRLPQAPRWQAWRYFLAPLSFSGPTLSWLMALAPLLMNLMNLESNVFRSRSRTAYYLLTIFTGLNLVGPYLDSYCYLSGLVNAITYTMSVEAPDSKVQYLVVSLPMRYAPWANLVLSFIASGAALESIYEGLLGIILAHGFLFFTELLPQGGGPSALSRTPGFLRYLDRMEENEHKRGQYGAGRKLGNERKWF